jgi:hypothetical protein
MLAHGTADQGLIMQAPRVVIPALIMVAALAAGRVQAGDHDLKCTMTFQLQSWSIFYQSAIGSGLIHCSDGQSLRVKLSAKGGGLTAGKSEESGKGEFSAVDRIDDLLGAYAQAQAHAGAINSVQAQVLTKGVVSLALSGKGHGWSLGVDVGELKIER